MKNVNFGESILPVNRSLYGFWFVPAAAMHWHDGTRPDDPDRVTERWLTWDRSAPMRRYQVLSKRSLLPDFVALTADPDEGSISRFAGNYGPLGVEEAFHPAGTSRYAPGEALGRWQTEVLHFGAIWALANRPRSSSEDEQLARRINAKLEETVAPGLRLSGKEFQLRITPNSLLGAVYLLLAQRLAGGVDLPLAHCRNSACPIGGVFQPKRSDQQFCSDSCRKHWNYLKARKGEPVK